MIIREHVLDELKTAALKKALTECVLPRGDLVNFVHKHPDLINEGLFEFNKTMLHLAASAGKLEIVQWLIRKGARVDVADSDGSSRTVVANNINVVDKNGQTPLDYALAANANSVVDYLRAKGGRTGAELNKTPDHASNRSDLSSSAVPDASYSNKDWHSSGLDFLLREIERKERPSAELMKSLALNPGMVNSSADRLGTTLLHHAATHRRHEIVKYLCLRHSANINAVDKDGQTPLDYALAANANTVVDYLRAKGGRTGKQLRQMIDQADKGNELDIPMSVDVPLGKKSNITKRIGANKRFIDNGDGTVTDTRTGLMWMRCAEGQEWTGSGCSGLPKKFDFEEARSIQREFAGYDDWRLPTREELESVVDRYRANPAVDENVFIGYFSSNPLFWSSTDGCWYVSFYSGSCFPANTKAKNCVRLVRGAYPVEIKNDLVTTEFNGSLEKSEKLIQIHVIHAGTGKGSVIKHPERVSYQFGDKVRITAVPEKGSFFSGWTGDVSGGEKTFELRVEADKKVFANFEVETCALFVSLAGQGVGVVMEGSQAFHESGEINKCRVYPAGKTITLTAKPAPGSVFAGWSGAISSHDPIISLMVHDDLVVVANFKNQKNYNLSITRSGSGGGEVTCSPAGGSYPAETFVTLTAIPETGSVFIGWRGEATGMDSCCSIEIDAEKSVIAEFQKIEIPDLEIAVNFDSVEQASMRSGDDAFIVYLAIANKGQKQIRIELPPASYMTQEGEEIEQDVWLSGLINGEKGASIRAGAFRKVGLVFYKQKLESISTGDQLFFSVCQTKPAQRFNFTLRCVDKNARAFVLILADVEEMTPLESAAVIPEVVASYADSAEIMQRIEMLQATLDEVLRQLSKLQTPLPLVIPQSAVQSESTAPASSQTTQQTLQQVLDWLATQERVSAATLRNLLLPLDLLPSALVDEINELALDRVGEPALEDQNDEILVVQDVLAAILIDWGGLNETSNTYEE